ncbi:class B sortase [Solibacillus sp. FSL W7-1436]|uniref:class B sortase n=1 Tax=Solibacillus sp. FSL W7-1436 TaxID=2921705 RepID=UPI0030FA8B58
MRKIVHIVSGIVMIICAGIIIRYFFSYQEMENELQDARQIVEQSELATLQQQHDHIIGWLTLENTRLNNPVLQRDNNEFYLTHNYLDEKSRGGSIFADFRNEVMEDRHTIFYGHVLRNGTMFGDLPKFSEQAYAEAHPVFYYETNDKRYALHVFAAYKTTTEFYYIETQFTDYTYTQFLEEIHQRSDIKLPVPVTATDKIVTFSTCTTSQNDKERFVVHAKVVELQNKR